MVEHSDLWANHQLLHEKEGTPRDWSEVHYSQFSIIFHLNFNSREQKRFVCPHMRWITRCNVMATKQYVLILPNDDWI
jgi:hypothetical protein